MDGEKPKKKSAIDWTDKSAVASNLCGVLCVFLGLYGLIVSILYLDLGLTIGSTIVILIGSVAISWNQREAAEKRKAKGAQ